MISVTENPPGEGARKRPVVLALVGLFIVLVVPQLVLIRWLAHGGVARPDPLHEIFFWALTLILMLYVLAAERRPLSSVGLKAPTWRSFAWGVPGGLCVAVGIGIIYVRIFPLLHLTMNRGAMAQIMATSFLFRFLLVLRAAVFEELFYRGYAIERLAELTRMPKLSGAISLAAFTLAHLPYWGSAQLLIAAYAGLILTALYLWRRDLACNMVTHFVADGLGFLLG